MCPYSIKPDDIGFCTICAAEHKKPKGPTICIIVTDKYDIISLSLCEDHLLEIGEALITIKKSD